MDTEETTAEKRESDGDHSPISQSVVDRPYIFVSYKREEAKVAEALKDFLEADGFHVWFDSNVQCGRKWATVIDRHLEHAACVVVLWSQLSNESPWVRHEASHAMARKVYAPCRIELVEITAPYNQIQAAELTGWSGKSNHPGIIGLRDRIVELLPDNRTVFERLLDFIQRNVVAMLSTLFAIVAIYLLFSLSRSTDTQLTELANLTVEQKRIAAETNKQLAAARDQRGAMSANVSSISYEVQRTKTELGFAHQNPQDSFFITSQFQQLGNDASDYTWTRYVIADSRDANPDGKFDFTNPRQLVAQIGDKVLWEIELKLDANEFVEPGSLKAFWRRQRTGQTAREPFGLLGIGDSYYYLYTLSGELTVKHADLDSTMEGGLSIVLPGEDPGLSVFVRLSK